MKHTYCNYNTPLKEDELPEVFGKRYKPMLQLMLNLDKNFSLDFATLINDIPQEHYNKLNNCEEIFLDKKASYLYFVEETDRMIATDLGIKITYCCCDKEYYFSLNDILQIDHFSKTTPIATFNIDDGNGGVSEYNFYILKTKDTFKLLMLKKIIKNETKNPKLIPAKVVVDIDVNDLITQTGIAI